MSSPKGQVFLADFLFSTVFLVASAVILFTAWSRLQADFQDARDASAISTFAHALTESLVSSPGVPADWDSTTVSSVGLASERFVIDSAKLLELRELGYDQLRFLLGVGYLGVNISIKQNNSIDYSGVLREPIAYYSCSEKFAGPLLQGTEFDYYWCGEGAEQHFGERNFYAGGKVSALNALLANQSEYNSILVEAPEMDSAQVASIDLDALRTFLSESGTLVYAGDGNAPAMLLGSGFDAEFAEAGGARSGTVTQTGYMFYNVSIGAGVSTDSVWGVNASGTAFIEDDSSAVFASWNYGSGTIHFLPDLEADLNGTQATQALNLKGWPLSFGASPSNPSTVFVVSQPCLVQGDLKRPVVLELTFWGEEP